MEAAISNSLDGRMLEGARRQPVDFEVDDAVIDLTADGRIIRWNIAAERLFDLGVAGGAGASISSRKLALAAIGLDELLAGATGEENATSVTRDLSLSISPILDRRGRIIGASLVTRDTSARIREQRRQTLVIQELNHRMRNIFAVVQATARQVLKDWKDPESPSALFLERLNALARNQVLLDRNSRGGLSIRDVAFEQAAPYAGGNMVRCTCEGPDIALKPTAASALGMAFHELATNSAKYGAFSSARGRVQVSWTTEGREPHRRLRLCWREFDGPAVKASRRRGLGSRMLERGIAIELGGSAELRFHPAGVWYALTAPLASIAMS